MKLLDLQTGKYLEIGYDWGYYGEYIVKFKIPYKFHFFTKEAYTIEDMCDRCAFKIIPHTNPIINQIAEKVGAVIYGGRYVLAFEDSNGDVFCEKTNFATVYYISKNQYRFFPVKDFNENNDINATVDRFFMLNKAPQYKIANIFEEFSKKEQGLENKFDELCNLIYGTK